MSMTPLPVLALLVLCHGCGAPAAPVREPAPSPVELPPLDRDLVEDVYVAMGRVEGSDMILDVASGALAEIEKDRLPAAIVEVLDAFRHVEEERRAELLAEAVETSMVEWKQVCEDGDRAFDDLQFLGAEEKTPALYDACDLGRFGFLEREDVVGAPVMQVLLAFLIYGYLETRGALEDVEVELLEALVLGEWPGG